MAEFKGVVSVEKVAHRAVLELAQDLWDQHGLRLDEVSFDWVDCSSPGEPKHLVRTATLRTFTQR